MGTAYPSRLDIIRANATAMLEEALASIRRRDAREQHGLAYFEAAYMYRRLAICELLAEARADRFHAFLRKSGHARLHFLRLVAAGHPTQPLYVCGSENRSLFDAIASGDTHLAAGIARLSTDKPNLAYEYEDDFLLYEFVRRQVLSLDTPTPGQWPGFASLLARWEAVLEGEEEPYLDVCRALLARDAEAFEQALLELIAARARRFEDLTDESGPQADIRWTEGPLFINGLALVRLAEHAGIRTAREHPTIPGLARSPVTLPPEVEAWSDARAGVPD